jgi:hypothetical protein
VARRCSCRGWSTLVWYRRLPKMMSLRLRRSTDARASGVGRIRKMMGARRVIPRTQPPRGTVQKDSMGACVGPLIAIGRAAHDHE